MRFTIAAVDAVALALPAFADPYEAPLPEKGEVMYAIDGDGFCVGKDWGGNVVRVADVNARSTERHL